MMKKMIALVLALVLCLTMFAGCGKDEAKEDVSSVIDYAAAFAKYEPETVVMTIDGKDVSWSEFYYMLYSSVSQLQYYLGDVVWNEEVPGGDGATIEEYVMQLTENSLKQFYAIDRKAREMNVALTDDDQSMLEANQESFKLQSCGEEATEEDFDAFLLENFFVTRDVYEFIMENAVLYEKLFVESIGEQGEKVSDDEIRDFIETTPFITVMHILMKTIDDSGAALSKDEIKTAKETAEQFLSQLQAITDREELVSTFKQLMKEYGQDEGTTMFPEGYTFTYGQMYPVFEETAFDLEEYQISEIVESEAGYHILLRMPTERDSLVEFDYQNNVYYTIETYATTVIYDDLVTSWMEDSEITWTEKFEGITAEEIFS